MTYNVSGGTLNLALINWPYRLEHNQPKDRAEKRKYFNFLAELVLAASPEV